MAIRKTSAGLLLFRRSAGVVEVLIGHMGGPFWARKEDGAWSIPKGEYDGGDESPLHAAMREFTEELGLAPPDGERIDLGEVKQSGGKVVRVFAVEGDFDPDDFVPGTFTIEWPPRSGRLRDFPELDRIAWCAVDDAATKMVRAQREFITRLADELRTRSR